MIRWLVNIAFSCFCITAAWSIVHVAHGAGLIVMLPYVIFELVQVVILMSCKPPKDGPGALSEYVIPLLGAGWPILINHLLKPNVAPGHEGLKMICTIVLFIVYLTMLTTLLTIRYSFSILPEARKIVTKGLYRFVRHPLYALYFLWGALNYLITLDLKYFSVAFVPMFAFLYLRARIEERKLAANLPGYVEYQQKTGMFFPNMK